MKKRLTEEARDEAIRAAVVKMLGDKEPEKLPPSNIVSSILRRGLGLHQSKEHLAKDQDALGALQQAIGELRTAIDNLPEDQRERIEHDAWLYLAGKNSSRAEIVFMEGFFVTQIDTVEEMTLALSSETRRLSVEQAERWSQPGPNYYRAKDIAWNLAELYVRELREKPVCSINDKDVVSGAYGCALQEIFEILGIKKPLVRQPAKAAIEEIWDAFTQLQR